MSRFFPLLAAALLLAGVASAQNCPAPSHMRFDKGEFSPQEKVTFILSDFSARQTSQGKKAPQCFARITEIEHGDVTVTGESLTNYMRAKIKDTSKLKEIKLDFSDQTAHLSGKAHKMGMWIPFTIEGPVSTDGRELILAAKSIKAAGLPAKALMSAVGEHLSTMLQSTNKVGVKAEGDAIVFDPAMFAHVHGTILHADAATTGLHVIFGKREAGGTTVARAK